MDGQLNCRLVSDSAAHTKIRHLENRVVETETRLDVLEQETTQLDEALQDALTNLGEKVETDSVDTTSLSANTVEAVNVISDNINTGDLTATAIDVETISVDNLENVNVLHGKTVDVEKTIATIGQFTETQTTTANNSTTNTATLNVDGETNLTGQVNIDGDMTFTKDNGLSKLQGNYLEIDAANVVIDNKNDAEYALYVPGVNGDALFGGSVAVQDTLAAKNIVVTETAVINNAQLDSNAVLENPTFENIAETMDISDKALDIDENGKLVRKHVGGSAFDGMSFYDGKFYDKVVTNTRELLDYILDTTNKDAIKIYSILFTGNKIHFDASVLPEEAIQADQVIGTYKVYHDTEDNTKELSFLDNNYEPYGEYEPLAYFKELLDKVHFYGFKTELDVISNEGLAAEYSKCLHINNCYFDYSENYYTNTVAFRLILKNCNNVEIGSNLKWNSTAILNLEHCNGIYATDFGMGKSDATNVEILMVHSNNCCVEIPSAVVGTVTYTQGGPGDNLVVHYQVADDGTKIDPTYTKYW